MRAYHKLADIYDTLMEEAPYNKWVQFVTEAAHHYGLPGRKVLDLACGTGTLPLMLKADGYEVTGVDLSEEMLVSAAEKSMASGQPLRLVQQDMRELEMAETFSLITIFCDSLNYLDDLEDVNKVFAHVYRHLQPGGLLLFDVHTTAKINMYLDEAPFVYNEDDLAYIWECGEGSSQNSVCHYLTIFAEDNNDHYLRFQETHKQRAFSLQDLMNSLKEAGFSDIVTGSDFSTGGVCSDEDERLFFVCRRSS